MQGAPPPHTAMEANREASTSKRCGPSGCCDPFAWSQEYLVSDLWRLLCSRFTHVYMIQQFFPVTCVWNDLHSTRVMGIVGVTLLCWPSHTAKTLHRVNVKWTKLHHMTIWQLSLTSPGAFTLNKLLNSERPSVLSSTAFMHMWISLKISQLKYAHDIHIRGVGKISSRHLHILKALYHKIHNDKIYITYHMVIAIHYKHRRLHLLKIFWTNEEDSEEKSGFCVSLHRASLFYLDEIKTLEHPMTCLFIMYTCS